MDPRVLKDKRVEMAEISLENPCIPVGESRRETDDCIRLLMSDDRIPSWNSVFMRILAATSLFNIVTLGESGIKYTTLAPWKLHSDVLILKESEPSPMWDV